MNEKQVAILKVVMFFSLLAVMLFFIYEQKTYDNNVVELLKTCDYQEICKTCQIAYYLPPV